MRCDETPGATATATPAADNNTSDQPAQSAITESQQSNTNTTTSQTTPAPAAATNQVITVTPEAKPSVCHDIVSYITEHLKQLVCCRKDSYALPGHNGGKLLPRILIQDSSNDSTIPQPSRPSTMKSVDQTAGSPQWLPAAMNAVNRDQMYRVVTIAQIACSCVSLLTACIVLPVMYNSVQQTTDYVQRELTFCETSSEDALNQLRFASVYGNRTARQAYGQNFGQQQNQFAQAGPQQQSFVAAVTGIPLQQECPGCCISGPPGPRGPAGDAGAPGNPGSAGVPGMPGLTPNQTCPKFERRNPPPCRQCPRGPPGIKGWPGFPGDPGPIGKHGEKGKDGSRGSPGRKGPTGPQGYKGPPGPPGDKGLTPQATIEPGPPGDPGIPGPIGPMGLPGMPGQDGLPGSSGEPGWPGKPGERGEPGYPGPEGPEGGVGPPGAPGTCVCQNVDQIIVVDAAGQPAGPIGGYGPQAGGYGPQGGFQQGQAGQGGGYGQGGGQQGGYGK